MPYPSIISQPGSAARNVQPIIQALESVLFTNSMSPGSITDRSHILEIASYPYEHITAFAERWESVEWWGTGRDDGEVREISDLLNSQNTMLRNLHTARRLDIASEDDWETLRQEVRDARSDAPKRFAGAIMLNLIHCCPADYPIHFFRNLSPLTENGRTLLDGEKGWIVAYGPFKDDDGSYKTLADAEFDGTYIKAKYEQLGLRTINSITDIAERWGFTEESRTELPKGNMFVVWMVKR